jgi:hypothetical protein
MITCKLEVPVVNNKDSRFFMSREFEFPNVPRVGEIIWLAETVAFKIEQVEYGFDTNETLTISLVSDEQSSEWFKHHEQFMVDWIFSR